MGESRTRRRAITPGALAVAGVMVLAGTLFTVNARLSGGRDDRSVDDLRDLARAETARYRDQLAHVSDLRAERDRLAAGVATQGAGAPATPSPSASSAQPITPSTSSSGQPITPPALSSGHPTAPSTPSVQDIEVLLAAGRTPVAGPGLRVQLDDAPSGPARPPGARPDDLVVHQSDLEAVVNALWAGGAEAMTIQGQRVSSLTAVRCVGNVLLLHGVTYSPPYVVSAVGDAGAMRATLDSSPGVAAFRQAVDAWGLGWSVSDLDRIEMPGYQGTSTDLHYARVVGAGTTDRATSSTTDGPQ